MRFKTVTHYVEKSYQGRPSFIVVLEDIATGIETSYISSGCDFVENTEVNIEALVSEYDCKEALDLLLNSPITSLKSITNGRSMFRGCDSLTEFKADLSSLTNGSSMFSYCDSLTEFEADLSSLTNGSSMFRGCDSLTEFEADLSSLTNGTCMFKNCDSLNR